MIHKAYIQRVRNKCTVYKYIANPLFHAKSKCALKCIKRQFAKINENWEWKLQASYEFGENKSFIPLVHDKRKDFRISKQLEVLGGNHAELSIQKNTFFLKSCFVSR